MCAGFFHHFLLNIMMCRSPAFSGGGGSQTKISYDMRHIIFLPKFTFCIITQFKLVPSVYHCIKTEEGDS